MALPSPNLDDRRFDDLVEDARRMIAKRCPEWTNHNLSDPGITLIETFALMTEQLLYRLNQVPDRLYLRFLELIGLRLIPPTCARAPVTFWLSAPASTPLVIRGGTGIATMRTETEEPITFSTTGDLHITPCSITSVRTVHAGTGNSPVHTEELRIGNWFNAFNQPPVVGDHLLIGLDPAAPSCAVRLDFQGRIDGLGVDPQQPPLAWEAWDGDQWTPCDISLDETGGLNRDGVIELHVPPTHRPAVLRGERAGWIRARVTDQLEGQPGYTSTPRVHGLTACTVGGTVEAVHGDIRDADDLGECEGVPGQRLTVPHTPVLVLPNAEAWVETTSDDGWERWTRVEDFAVSGPQDRHFVLDAVTGEVRFGPLVREPDGSARQYGAVPRRGARARIRRYATGGGSAANVGRRAISTLKASIPFVSAVENRRAAHGGTDPETVDEARLRGPLFLRTRDRAVTAEDFEVLAQAAAPELARVRCVPADAASGTAGVVRVLVVASAPARDGRIALQDLAPDRHVMQRVTDRLDAARIVGTRVVVEPPLYRGVTIVARLVTRPRTSAERVETRALDALYAFLSPLRGGGPNGRGWPFGRPIHAGEVFAVLQSVPGVERVEDVRLFAANPVTGERGPETQRIALEPNSLVFSFEHQVLIEEAAS